MSKVSGLRLWDGSRGLADDVIAVCRRFPRKDDPAELASQLARAANSVPANISEALGRGTRGEILYHLRVARGSLEETKSHLRACVNATLIDKKTFYRFWNRAVAISRMLASYMARVERTPNPRSTPRPPPSPPPAPSSGSDALPVAHGPSRPRNPAAPAV